jgi:hypothetical protein
MTTKTSLGEKLDDYYLALLEECQPGKTDESAPDGGTGDALPMPFLDRLKLFEAGVRWVAVKNKVEAEVEQDAFGKLRSKYNRQRGAGGRGAPAAPSNGAASAPIVPIERDSEPAPDPGPSD